MADQNQDPRRSKGRSRNAWRRVAWTAVVGVVVLAGPIPRSASAVTNEPPPVISTITVRGGPGNQTDPHVSGNLVSYTSFPNVSGEIRYQNLATGVDAAVPNGGHRDELSDISGTTIVFQRWFLDGTTSTRPIMAFDTATGEPPVELDPQPGIHRSEPAIGGRTVAWSELVPGSPSASNLVVYDLETKVATPLTFDGNAWNRDLSVSPDGSVVTWSRCTIWGTDCDVHTATQAGSTWITTALTDGPGEHVLSDSNGEVVVYMTNASGDLDIAWTAVGGHETRVLRLPESREHRPSISGGLVSIERDEPDSPNSDLWLYDLATDTLYQLTDTPAVDEHLNDISVSPDGIVRVVWAQADGSVRGSNDVFAMLFRLDANRPPDCSAVSPSANRLWPPDHKLQPVTLGGATDPDGDPVTLTVTGVSQDEPVEGIDDGNTAPDAQLGASSNQVLLRAERSESGDGRLYRITFSANDSKQGNCSGVVTVGVPVVRAGGVTDSGGSYDSLEP